MSSFVVENPSLVGENIAGIIIDGNIRQARREIANKVVTIPHRIVVIRNLVEFAARPSEMTGRIPYM